MFESREQRIAVVKTLFGAIGAPYWINDDGIQGKALEHYDKLQKGETLNLSHSGDWLYAAVRNNRRLSGLPPQGCTCDKKGD